MMDVQNFVVIAVLGFGWEATEILIAFELWWKDRQWNGFLELVSLVTGPCWNLPFIIL